MPSRRLLLPALGVLGALAMSACDPASPADPDPVTPPETVSTDPLKGEIPMPPPPEEVNEAMDSAGAPARQLDSACGTITADGLCGVSFGMSADEAREAHQGDGLLVMGDPTQEQEACYYLGPQQASYDIGYMVVDGTVQRIDIRAPGVATGQAVQVGMPAGEVEGIYPGLERQPNKYSDRDDLIVQLEGEAKLIMETDDSGNISAFRIGLPPAVDYVEGCA